MAPRLLPAGALQKEVQLADERARAVVDGALARRGLCVDGQRGQRGAAVHRAQRQVDSADDWYRAGVGGWGWGGGGDWT